MTRTQEIKVAAQLLQAGDYLPATKSTVLANYGAGVRTPRGKVELQLESRGKKRLATWGKYTEITVVRAAL